MVRDAKRRERARREAARGAAPGALRAPEIII